MPRHCNVTKRTPYERGRSTGCASNAEGCEKSQCVRFFTMTCPPDFRMTWPRFHGLLSVVSTDSRPTAGTTNCPARHREVRLSVSRGPTAGLRASILPLSANSGVDGVRPAALVGAPTGGFSAILRTPLTPELAGPGLLVGSFMKVIAPDRNAGGVGTRCPSHTSPRRQPHFSADRRSTCGYVPAPSDLFVLPASGSGCTARQ